MPDINRSIKIPYLHSDVPRVLLLVAAVLLLGLYWLVRYQGNWADTDTASFSLSISSMIEDGALVPGRNVYNNGYGYPVLGASLSLLGGMSVSTLQSILAPLLAAWLVLPAWLAYREFTGSGKIAALATAILLIQPEFLFPILRGSHEKFTRGLMFLCLYLLLRSLRSRTNLRRFVGFLVAFYISAYALVTYNNLIAFSFIFSLGLSLILLWVAKLVGRRRTESAHPPLTRLLTVVLTLMVIAFLFTFYAYPPAQSQINLMQSVQDRVASLFLTVENTPTNPYTVINSGWTSLTVYLLVSLANWLLLLGSALIWLNMTIAWLKRQRTPGELDLLMWSFYGAFAFMGVVSVVVDVSGAIAANLQHRMFPSFAMLAAPLAARWLWDRLFKPGRAARFAQVMVALGIGVLAVLSVFKATNEPLLSNYWILFHDTELQSLDWVIQNQQGSRVWTGFSERLATAYNIWRGEPINENQLDSYLPKYNTSTFVVSDLTRVRSSRLGVALPIQIDSLRIYDNGETAIFRRRPITPFQR